MIFVAVNILFLLFVFTGIGLLFPWSVFRYERRFEPLLMCFWIGWGLAAGFLQIWHLIFPANLGAFVVLLVGGAAGWWRARALVAETARRWNRTQALALALLALIPCGMLANHVLFSQPNSDYALYHMQTVKWYMQYAIVPGLGNLYHPLVWNYASFLYTATINSGWLADRAYYVSNTLPAYAIVLQAAAGLYGLFARRPLRFSDLFYALMIPVVLNQASTAYLVAYSPDPLMFFMQVIIAGQLVAVFEDRHDLQLYQRRSAELVLLAAAGACVKLSFAIFGVLCLLVMVLIGIQRYQNWPWRNARLWWGWIALGLAFILPWLGRNVILSGYPLFPNTAISVAVPWKIPALIADAAQPIVAAWARTVNGSIEYTGDWAWFLEWYRRFPFEAKQAFFFSLGLLAFDLLLWVVLRLQTRSQAARTPARDRTGAWDPGMALILISAPSLVFWFVMGPSYRFSGALFWILLVAALLIGVRLLLSSALVTRPEVLALSLVLAVSLWQSPNHFSNNLSRRMLFLPPTESALAEQAMPLAGMRQRATGSGLVINLPHEGVEECWNAPLPCTTEANFLSGLREIEPGNLQKGFILQLKD